MLQYDGPVPSPPQKAAEAAEQAAKAADYRELSIITAIRLKRALSEELSSGEEMWLEQEAM